MLLLSVDGSLIQDLCHHDHASKRSKDGPIFFLLMNQPTHAKSEFEEIVEPFHSGSGCAFRPGRNVSRETSATSTEGGGKTKEKESPVSVHSDYRAFYSFHVKRYCCSSAMSAISRNSACRLASSARRLARMASSSTATITSSKKRSTGARNVARISSAWA